MTTTPLQASTPTPTITYTDNSGDDPSAWVIHVYCSPPLPQPVLGPYIGRGAAEAAVEEVLATAPASMKINTIVADGQSVYSPQMERVVRAMFFGMPVTLVRP